MPAAAVPEGGTVGILAKAVALVPRLPTEAPSTGRGESMGCLMN